MVHYILDFQSIRFRDLLRLDVGGEEVERLRLLTVVGDGDSGGADDLHGVALGVVGDLMCKVITYIGCLQISVILISNFEY